MKNSTTAGSPTKVDDPEAEGWARGAPKAAAADESPAEKPKADRKGPSDGDFITRSTLKRDTTKVEENKERDFGGMRRNKPKEDEPAGFARGNFKSKRDEEAPKRDGPPRFTRGEKRDTDKKGDDSGFGFRSNPKGRGKR